MICLLFCPTRYCIFNRCSGTAVSTKQNSVGEWHAGGTHFSAKYSPLDQIDSSNFAELEVAWDWQSADSRIPRSLASTTSPYRATPLFVNGVMYTNTSLGRIAALDPVSGEELWVFDPESYRLTIGRGVKPDSRYRVLDRRRD